jgi:hypothetical protein
MHEREPRKEIIGRGELFFLSHPGAEETFSGYGLTMQPGNEELLIGLLMIDRPHPADPEWLAEVQATFGEYELVAMTPARERGIACQMQIEPESLPHLRRFPGERAAAIQTALQPLLVNPPKPIFTLRWDEEARNWRSEFAATAELPEEIRRVFEGFGYGCLAAETNIGVVHVCHAADSDIEGFANQPVSYQWQLVKMPTAPLIRLELTILDRPGSPYRFESFLNVAEEDQAKVLAQLAGQGQLYLAFYGDDLTHRFTKIINHDRQQWQYLDELVAEALEHRHQIPPEQRDFDQAKAEFMQRYM